MRFERVCIIAGLSLLCSGVVLLMSGSEVPAEEPRGTVDQQPNDPVFSSLRLEAQRELINFKQQFLHDPKFPASALIRSYESVLKQNLPSFLRLRFESELRQVRLFSSYLDGTTLGMNKADEMFLKIVRRFLAEEVGSQAELDACSLVFRRKYVELKDLDWLFRAVAAETLSLKKTDLTLELLTKFIAEWKRLDLKESGPQIRLAKKWLELVRQGADEAERGKSVLEAFAGTAAASQDSGLGGS